MIQLTKRLARRTAGARWAFALLALGASVACGDDALVTLGQEAPVVTFIDNGEAVAGDVGRPIDSISGLDNDQNATLTGDLLELYFTSNRPGGPGRGDVWVARRSARNVGFGAPELVEAANSEFVETSAAISLDGLTLWLGSNRPGAMGGELDTDIWLLERESRQAPWQPARLAAELNSTEKDIPRPAGARGRVMPLASERSSAGLYQTYLAERRDPEGPFGPARLVEELVVNGEAVVDAFLSEDGRLLLFNRESADEAKLELAWRIGATGPFSRSMTLDGLNADGDERDPWLSPDGTLLVFTSNRFGQNDIFATSVRLTSFQ